MTKKLTDAIKLVFKVLFVLAKHLECLIVDQDVVEQFSYMNVYELSQFRILFNEFISICKTLSKSCVTVIFSLKCFVSLHNLFFERIT